MLYASSSISVLLLAFGLIACIRSISFNLEREGRSKYVEARGSIGMIILRRYIEVTHLELLLLKQVRAFSYFYPLFP